LNSISHELVASEFPDVSINQVVSTYFLKSHYGLFVNLFHIKFLYQIQKLYDVHLEKNILLSSKERKHLYGAPKLWNLAISRERNKGKIVCSGPLKQTWAGVELVNKFQYQVQKGVRREWYDFVIDDESKEVNGGLDDSDKNTRRRREQVSQRNVLLHTAKTILKAPPVKNVKPVAVKKSSAVKTAIAKVLNSSKLVPAQKEAIAKPEKKESTAPVKAALHSNETENNK
jgi:hypothetical protein